MLAQNPVQRVLFQGTAAATRPSTLFAAAYVIATGQAHDYEPPLRTLGRFTVVPLMPGMASLNAKASIGLAGFKLSQANEDWARRSSEIDLEEYASR